jgi:hypothetical protein
MKEWQFNVLFFVGVLGAVVMLIGPEIGLDIGKNPTAVTGVGAILTYVLTQKKAFTKSPPDGDKKKNDSEKRNDGV